MNNYNNNNNNNTRAKATEAERRNANAKPNENGNENDNENENETDNITANAQNDNETAKITKTTTTTNITPSTVAAAANKSNSNSASASQVAAPAPPAAAAATTACSNQETETVAMMDSNNSTMEKMLLHTPNTNQPTIMITTQATLATETAQFAVPAIPGGGSGVGVGGVGDTNSVATGAKKRRNKSAKKHHENETRHHQQRVNNHKNGGGSGGGGLATCAGVSGGPVADAGTPSVIANIKTSVSMTSLPPDVEKAESRDVIKAKLRVERPYNSLKKNAERHYVGNNLGITPNGSQSGSSSYKNHRYSWGSGYSYSSSSLHSNATLGLGSAKDDLWAAIQTNYDYIMDTNLLDTCKEACCEIEGAASALQNQPDYCLKMLNVSQRCELLWDDPNELCKWLCEMEEKLKQAPTLTEATAMSIAELQRYLAEHTVLYHEIVSHDRVVSACIRAASEREQKLLQQQQEQLELEHEQQLLSLSSNDTSTATIAERANSSLSSTDDEPSPATPTTRTAATATAVATIASNKNSSSSSSSGIERGDAKTATTSPANSSLTSSTTLTSPVASSSSSRSAAAAAAIDTATNFGCSSGGGKSEGGGSYWERLQKKYHLLYLKAFEVQLWLDGLLRKKSSATSFVDHSDCIDGAEHSIEGLDSSEYDDDDDGDDIDQDAAATEDDLNDATSDLESDITQNSSSFCDLPHCENPSTDATHDCVEVKGDCEDGDDEEEDEDEVDCGHSSRDWPSLGYSAVLVTYDKGGHTGNNAAATTLTDFEADSESSDWEVAQQLRAPRKGYNLYYSGPVPPKLTTNIAATTKATNDSQRACSTPTTATTPTNSYIATTSPVIAQHAQAVGVSAHDHNFCHHLEQQQQQPSYTGAAATSTPMHPKMSSNSGNAAAAAGEQTPCGNLLHMSSAAVASTGSVVSTTTATAATQTQQKLQTLLHGNCAHASAPIKQKSIAVISPNSHNNNSNHNGNAVIGYNNKSPTVLRKRQQQQQQSQQRHIDISKFNRSNRKSKNCAIFYFKHLDTDNETNCSSVGGDGEVSGVGAVGDLGDGLSSSTSQTSEHLLKSADASSDDDEGWLYSSVCPQAAIANTVDCLNTSNSNNSGHNKKQQHSGIATLIVDGIQSAAVSSSTVTTTTTTVAAAIISDDSDKENKEAQATATATATATAATVAAIANHRNSVNSSTPSSSSSLHSTQIATAEIQLAPARGAAATVAAAAAAADASATFVASTNVIGSSGSGSSCYSTRSSSCSSNDLLTETTTSATTTTQITQMHFQRMHRSEMELQINGGGGGTGGCNNKSKQIVSNNSNNNINNNANCATNLNNNNSNNDNNNDNNGNSYNNNNNNSGNNNNQCIEMKNVPQQQQQQLPLQQCDITNGNAQKDKLCFYTRADICNITVKPTDVYCTQQHLQLNGVGKRLPPRSPAKSGKSQRSGGNCLAVIAPAKGKVSHESIKQLVLEAEHLVRDAEALKTPTKQKQKQKHSMIKLSSTVKKREVIMPGPIKQRVQEWLEHQPSTPMQLHKLPTHEHLNGANASGGSPRSDDCEASGEASETDSIPQPGSDTSEGFTDSIATCMQTSTNSFGGTNSTERIGGSAEPIIGPTTTGLGYGSSNQSLNVKITKRPQVRRKSERPWSVSCLSQLTTDVVQTSTVVAKVSDVQAGLATHSISESALDSLSPGRPRACSASTTHVAQVKTYDSKGSLKRRKTRKKKYASATIASGAGVSYSAGKKTPDTGSEETTEMPRLTQSLLMKSCESMSVQQIQEMTNALLSLQRGAASAEQINSGGKATLSGHQSAPQLEQLQQQQQQLQQQSESGEEAQLMKPNFRVGSYTTAYMRNEKRLGSLAALATYMNDEDEEQQGAVTPVPQKPQEYTTGTEDHHSSFSETAWDNYQEKYNSENYSEGFDSDAARRLMEFGDDYRNFIDSQSDCCSSLSAANNVDSLSPPRMDSLQPNETKVITQDTIVNSVDHARRRRALDLEYERRRKTLEVRRKSCQDSTEAQNPRSPSISLSSSANALTPKNAADKLHQQQHKVDSASRKLEFGMSHSAQSLRRTSESDTSTRRRKVDERRRSSRNLEKCIKLIPATSSSSGDDTDDEKEMRNLLQQSHNRLEDTRALKIRCHLLRPEDYSEIITTCRDNMRCLEAVLRGPPGTVLSPPCVSQTKDLLAAWDDLLGWSENAAAARKMQEEMILLKHSLNRLGNKATFELLDTEPQIQIAVEALKNDKSQLQNYRTNMLRLNASVHSWLTRQERRLQTALAEQQLKEAAAKVTAELAEHQEQQATTVLTEEQEEAESEQQQQQSPAVAVAVQLVEQAQESVATTTTTVTTITVTDSNGNQMETQTTDVTRSVGAASTNTAATSTTTAVGTSSEKMWDLQTLMNSENEFHKHLKDEVGDMYNAWDEADARINSQLEVLTNSLTAWRQLESGLYEFQQALGQDRGTLKGLEGALDKGQATPVELAQNVKLVAKLLSERVHVSQEQLTAVQEHLDPNHILHIAKFTASNGSLSDSGISDGGATSDGGLSERERRLGVLRRLAKQLESALAPGSEAMKSIAARMESAEAELKNLQNTCRDLIVRTAATHQNKKQQLQLQQQQQLALLQQQKPVPVEGETALTAAGSSNGYLKANGHAGGKKPSQQQDQQQQNSPSKRKNKRKQRQHSAGSNADVDSAAAALDYYNAGAATNKAGSSRMLATAPDSGDPADDPALEFDLDSSDEEGTKSSKNGWAWRIAKAAVPMQLALFTLWCAACLMQPNCCDNLNNLSMSFTPQLRYIRGPPPI